MTERELRDVADRHGAAVVAGDMDTVMDDIVADIHDQIPPLAARLPQPTRSAEVTDVRAEADGGIVETRYAGETSSLTVRSTWAARDGRPRIVAVTPVDADS